MEPKEHIAPNERGTLLGLVGPAWAVLCLILIATAIIISVFVIGDPDFS